MKLEVGELFYIPMSGICVLTEKYPEGSRYYNDVIIGTFCRLGFGSRVYKLYEDTKVYNVTDKMIKDFLLEEMCRFELSNEAGITISYGDFEGIGIYDQLEGIYLNKQEALKLREILNRELT